MERFRFLTAGESHGPMLGAVVEGVPAGLAWADAGDRWVLVLHGLIYLTPKHCVCWPMLRGYVALAADRAGGNPALLPIDQLHFERQPGE